MTDTQPILSTASKLAVSAARQSKQTCGGRLYNMFQSPILAVPTLIISTLFGGIFGTLFGVTYLYEGLVQPNFRESRWFIQLAIASVAIPCALTVIGINMYISKYFNYPLSRNTSIAITLTTLFALFTYFLTNND